MKTIAAAIAILILITQVACSSRHQTFACPAATCPPIPIGAAHTPPVVHGGVHH